MSRAVKIGKKHYWWGNQDI